MSTDSTSESYSMDPENGRMKRRDMFLAIALLVGLTTLFMAFLWETITQGVQSRFFSSSLPNWVIADPTVPSLVWGFVLAVCSIILDNGLHMFTSRALRLKLFFGVWLIAAIVFNVVYEVLSSVALIGGISFL